jgi:hypothetical protein
VARKNGLSSQEIVDALNLAAFGPKAGDDPHASHPTKS